MIGDLLDLTRARLGGAIPLKRRLADLHQVCEAVLEIRAGQREAVVRLECRGDLRGEWDTDRMAQVLSNLVGNAIQHGDGMPITITARDEGDSVSLAVHNAGAAIPADLLPSVFEPLARGDEESTPGSIGLGLFIARTIVLAHGGDIRVSSSPDAGTTFQVVLPKAER